MSDADTLMAQIGLKSDAEGPFARELRQSLAENPGPKIKRMHVDWAGGDAEARAREMLAVRWQIEHGHTYQMKNLDGGFVRTYRNFATGQRTYKLKWSWFGDLWRKSLCDTRRAFHRLTGVRNPYRD